MASIQLTYSDILTLLSIIAVGLLIVLLYNLIFVSISFRRISERLDDVSKDVETIILKPIGAIDMVIDWFLGMMDGAGSGKKKIHGKEEKDKKES